VARRSSIKLVFVQLERHIGWVQISHLTALEGMSEKQPFDRRAAFSEMCFNWTAAEQRENPL
jgi:hypothetical protein